MIELKEAPSRRPRGIYLLPNLFTTISLFAGFYAIVASMQGSFEIACIAIFIASISDALDGRVARLTHTQTEFGAQYDSLTDLVSFGVAPALLAYNWALHYLGKVGWLAAFIFTAAVALRLARFNTQLGSADKRYFQGLPCPSGAGVVVAAIWLATDYELSPKSLSFMLLVMTVLVSLVMVSNIRYRSFKDIDLKNKVPFIAIFTLALVLAGLIEAPPQMLFAGLLTYAISGPVLTLWGLRQKRRLRRFVNEKF